MTVNTTLNNLNNTRIAVSQWDKETSTSEHFKEVLGLCFDYLPQFVATPESKMFRPNSKAVPIFYCDNRKSKVKALWQDTYHYKNIEEIATRNGISVMQQLNKLLWNGNRHTGVILFSIENYRKSDLRLIYKAIANKKIVNVRTNTRIYRNVTLESKEWSKLNEEFQLVADQRQLNKERQNKSFIREETIRQLGLVKPDEKQQYIIEALAYFYELDKPTNDIEYTVTWKTIQAYLEANMPFSRPVSDNNKDTYNCIPQQIGNIDITTLAEFRTEDEMYGNMDIIQESEC